MLVDDCALLAIEANAGVKSSLITIDDQNDMTDFTPTQPNQRGFVRT